MKLKTEGPAVLNSAAPTIWKNICDEKDILPILRVRIGKYGCRSTSILQGWTHWKKMDVPKYTKDNGRIRFFWKPQGNNQLSASNAAGFAGMV